MMRRIGLVIALLCLGVHVSAAPAIVQYIVARSTSAASVTTTAISTTTGHAIVVFVSANTATIGATPITDSGSHTWTQAVPATGSQGASALYYNPSITGSGSHTFTFTPTANDIIEILVIEVSGLAASPLGQTDADSTSATNHTTGPITAAAGICELFIAAGGSADAGGPNYQPSGALTSVEWNHRMLNGASVNGLVWAWRIVASGASSTWTYATPDSDLDVALIAGFKSAVACGSGGEVSSPF
jgi:hypothetical protein